MMPQLRPGSGISIIDIHCNLDAVNIEWIGSTGDVWPTFGLRSLYLPYGADMYDGLPPEISRDHQMSRAPTPRFERLGNPKIACSCPEPAGSKPGRVKPKT